MTTQAMFKLPFDPVLQAVELGLSGLPPRVQYYIVVREFIGYLLDELSSKIWDREATSPVDLAVAYLKKNAVSEEYARQFSHHVLDAMLSTVLGYFPSLSFQQLAAGRFVLDDDNATLLVYLEQHHESTPY